MAQLSISELEAGYGEAKILSGVDLRVEKGEWVVIAGPNGAGKSTLMKSIFGLTTIEDGMIEFQEEDITAMKPKEIITQGISYVPQSDNIFPPLTIRENLQMGAYTLNGVPKDALDEIYEYFPVLEERKDQKAGTLSGGQQQMLAMGRALMLDPDLLMVDEPSAGLAPDLVEETFNKIGQINDSGTSVLMVEQNAKAALERCDRGYILAQGENRFTDTGQNLLDSQTVRREFLGG